MKKTLQKELKFQLLPNETNNNESVNNINKKNSITSQKLEETKNNIKNDNCSLMQSNVAMPTSLSSKAKTKLQQVSTDEVNFKYLKHVVLKFVTSREYEVSGLNTKYFCVLNFFFFFCKGCSFNQSFICFT